MTKEPSKRAKLLMKRINESGWRAKFTISQAKLDSRIIGIY